jgi:hypothetical protein
MPRFSRGISPQATRDYRRIVEACPEGEPRRELTRAVRRLMEEVAEDPHEKGEARPVAWNPWIRMLEDGPLQMFYWVRQPPLEDLYVEVIGFRRV